MTSPIRTDTLEHLTVQEMSELLNTTPEVVNVALVENTVVFRFRDRDGDVLAVLVGELDDQRIVIQTNLVVPNDNTIAALASANEWNGQAYAHGTFSHMGNVNGSICLFLESHLLVAGGVTQEAVRAWLSNFLASINRWEETSLTKFRSIPEDSKLMKGRTDWIGAFTPWVGEIARSYFSR